LVVEEQSIISKEPIALAEPSVFREIVETILLAAVVFLLVNTVSGRFSIDGPSMQPTLYKGEYVIVDRLSYKLHPPERGDVIVFKRNIEYIKRVIGLPGETIEIRDRQVFIDGEPLPESYVKELPAYSMEPRTIGPDEYFVLGDNRNNSSDSHNWGTVPFSTIDGKTLIIYWPPEKWSFVPHYSYPSLAS
jgi:signal peptidase I